MSNQQEIDKIVSRDQKVQVLLCSKNPPTTAKAVVSGKLQPTPVGWMVIHNDAVLHFTVEDITEIKQGFVANITILI